MVFKDRQIGSVGAAAEEVVKFYGAVTSRQLLPGVRDLQTHVHDYTGVLAAVPVLAAALRGAQVLAALRADQWPNIRRPAFA